MTKTTQTASQEQTHADAASAAQSDAQTVGQGAASHAEGQLAALNRTASAQAGRPVKSSTRKPSARTHKKKDDEDDTTQDGSQHDKDAAQADDVDQPESAVQTSAAGGTAPGGAAAAQWADRVYAEGTAGVGGASAGWTPALYVLGAASAIGAGIAILSDDSKAEASIATPTLALNSDTGTSATDFVTKDGTINVSAIAGTNSWEYSTDGGSTWTAGSGTSFTLAEGSYAAGAVQVRQKDATSGKTGEAGKIANAITVDKTAAAAPVINTVAGDDVVGQTEAQSPVTVSGTAEAGTSVAITWGATSKTVTAGTDGTWTTSFAASELPTDGAYTITAKATDAAGNISASGTRSVTVDTNHYITGSVYAGPTGAGIEVKAYKEDGTLLGTAVTDANGSYRIAFKGYTGLVLLSATDPAQDSKGHLDEATGAQADITVSLRAVTDFGIEGDVLVNLTPLTELATRLMSSDLSASGTTNLAGVTAQHVSNANETVANLFTDSDGDLTGQTVNLVMNAAAQDISATANLYGTQLAALQGFIAANSYTLSQGLDAITQILGGWQALRNDPIKRDELTDVQANFIGNAFIGGLDWVNAHNPTFIPAPLSNDSDVYKDKGVINDGKGPVFASGAAVSVSILETAPVNSAVIVSGATDPAGQVRYTLAWGDNVSLMAGPDVSEYFAINADTGAITLVGALDHEAKASYVLAVTAKDVWGNESVQTVTVNVGNVNEAPQFVGTLNDQIVLQGQPFSYTLPVNTFSDPDGDTLTYSAKLVTGEGNLIDLPSWLTFDPQTGVLSATSAPALSAPLTVRIIASDGSLSASGQFSISGVTAPTITAVESEVAAANVSRDLVYVVTLSEGVTLDQAADGTLGLDLDGDGSADVYATFDLTRTVALNDPTKLAFFGGATVGNSSDVRVVSIDFDGASGVQTDQPLATNVVGQQVKYDGAAFVIDNTLPGLIIGGFTVNENTTAVATLTATEAVTWGLMEEGDFALFTISETGQLSFVGPRNYETDAHSYSVNIRMEDRAGNVSTQMVTVNLADVNEAPVLNGSLPDAYVVANQPFSYTLPNGIFSDVDAGTTLTYTAQMVGQDGMLLPLPQGFSFDAQTGAITAQSIAFSGALTVRITASDGSLSVSDDIVLTCVDGPTITAITADVSAAKENTAVQFVVTFSENVTYGNDAGTIFVTADDGFSEFGLTFNSVATANLGQANKLIFSATMPSGDSSNLKISSIDLINVIGTVSGTAVLTDTVGQVVMYGSNPFVIDNTAPTLSVTTYNSPENATAVATLSASETVTWSLAPFGDGALFNLSADGQLSFKNAPDYETSPQSYTLDIIMTDVVGNVTNRSITVNVTNVNDAPIVNMPLQDQVVVANQAFSYTFAGDAFIDVDEEALTFTAHVVDGSGNLVALPSWLTFDSATRTFSSNSAEQFATPLTVRVTASDAASLSVSDDIVLTSVTAPSVTAIASGVSAAKQGASVQFILTLSESVMYEGNAGTIALTADGGSTQFLASFDANATVSLGQANKMVFSGAIPSGNSSNVQIVSLNLVDVTSSISGVAVLTNTVGQVVMFGSNPFVVDNTAPTLNVTTYNRAENGTSVATLSASESVTWALQSTNDGALFTLGSNGALSFKNAPNYEVNPHSYTLDVSMTDGVGNVTNQQITVNVTNVNEAPVVANPLVDQVTIQGQAFSYEVPSNSFTDVDAGTTLTYTAQLVGGGALPSWLTFNAATHTFSSASAPALGSPINVRVTASDGSLSVSDDFQISQQAVPTFSTSLSGVTNLDVRSDLVFTASENISLTTEDGVYTIELVNDANSGSKLGYSGTLGESIDNTQTLVVTVSGGVASATLNGDAVDINNVLSISGNKLIFDPVYDLDFSNNYHVEIDAGLFVGATSGLGNAALTSGTTFATVTPNTTGSGAALVSGGAASQIMNANDTLSASYKWVGIDRVGNTATQLVEMGSLDLGGYALVATDRAASDLLETWDFHVRFTDFGADDLIYIDNQSNGTESWNPLSFGSGTVDPNDVRIEFGTSNDAPSPSSSQAWFDFNTGGEWLETPAELMSYLGASSPLFVGA